jgi:hypothetical protein
VTLTLALCAATAPATEGDELFRNGFEVGLLANLYYVVAWEDEQADGNALQASARGFENRFAEINLSDLSAGHQARPDIGVAADGGFVAVWEDDTDLNGLYQIHARGFAPDGSARFSRITVNSVAAGQQRRPRVAVAPNGDFAVVWEDDPDGNGLYNLVGRGFYANGTQKWSDRDVALTGPGAELEPAIAMAGDGTFVVVWTDDIAHNGFFQVKARTFHANGTQRVAAFTVNSVGGGQQTQPDVAATLNGFVVVWADDSDVNWFRQIHARGFFSTGAQRFADITVNQVGTADQYAPAVAMAPDGSFAAAWVDQNHRIVTRQFGATGLALTPDLVLNGDGLPLQNRPAIAVSQDDQFVVAWDFLGENGRYGLKARRLDGAGGLGPERTLNLPSSGDQLAPAVAIQ